MKNKPIKSLDQPSHSLLFFSIFFLPAVWNSSESGPGREPQRTSGLTSSWPTLSSQSLHNSTQLITASSDATKFQATHQIFLKTTQLSCWAMFHSFKASVWAAVHPKAWTLPLCCAGNNCAQCWTADSWLCCAKGESSHASCGPGSEVETTLTPRDKRSSPERRGKSRWMDCCS